MRRVECGTTVRDDTWVLITFFAPWWWWPTNDEGWIDRQWSDDDNKLSHSWRVSSCVFVFMFTLDWFLLCTLYPFIWLNLNNWAIAQIDTWLLPFWHSLSLRFISSNYYRERWSGLRVLSWYLNRFAPPPRQLNRKIYSHLTLVMNPSLLLFHCWGVANYIIIIICTLRLTCSLSDNCNCCLSMDDLPPPILSFQSNTFRMTTIFHFVISLIRFQGKSKLASDFKESYYNNNYYY